MTINPDNVLAIRVGEENHAVEDETTGERLPEVVLTEQCDECGGTYPWIDRGPGVNLYECDGCGRQVLVFTTIAERVVFQ